MPALLRISVAWSLVTVAGISLMVHAHFRNGWDAIAYFAWGLIVTGCGLLGSMILSGIASYSIKQKFWKRFAVIQLVVSVILMLCLIVVWNWA